ncbi:ribosome assembly RNA-binding protein YhbY [Collinsella sp. zg1085]|uniref:ribosome assembly RNA-binding protein YhbY n=1 Tax=Collinsella sp. zg1085 TaxID=2844380 RepID=UPI001C0DFF47|nr:ribosome assembly RNA-binding protein YhbY [Collinsella sp. zg1085]QWT17845.1 ribosome assembly RNA-binding protein YhbY [Collinsella sp. zg1085]
MALSGKQVRYLRSLVHHANPSVFVGKADITDGVRKQVEDALEAHELIKCGVQDGSELTAREAAEALAEQLEADVVQVIGHRFSLYRKSHKKDIKHIELP